MRLNILNSKNIFYILINLIIAIVFIIILEILKYIFKIDEPDSNSIKEEFRTNTFISVFSIVVISPIIEELTFRLPLKKNEIFPFSTFFCLFFLFSTDFLIVKILIFIFLLLVLIYQNVKYEVWKLRILIIISIVTFISIHFDNFTKDNIYNLDLIELFFLFSPHLFLSIILTKIRMETGIINAIIFHSLYNIIILILALTFDD
jgi:hypothetical protein